MARKNHLPKRQTLVICVNGGLGLPPVAIGSGSSLSGWCFRERFPLYSEPSGGFISRSGMPGEAMEHKRFGNQVVASVQGISFGGLWS